MERNELETYIQDLITIPEDIRRIKDYKSDELILEEEAMQYFQNFSESVHYKLRELLLDPDLTHERFYKFLRDNLTLIEIVIRLYGNDFDRIKIHQMFLSLFTLTRSIEYLKLLVEPHIFLRFNEFVNYIKSLEGNIPDSEKLRTGFIEMFPQINLYRTLLIDSQTAKSISRSGFINNLSDSKVVINDTVNSQSGQNITDSLVIRSNDADFLSHIGLSFKGGFFTSWTSDPDLSESIVRYISEDNKKNINKRKFKLYTYSARVSAFYVFSPTSEEMGKERLKDWRVENPKGEVKRFKGDSDEHLVSLHIPAERLNLLRITEFDKAPKFYEGGYRRIE